ncbi:hypothetical protein ACTWLI_15760 [Arthrobacter sp. Hor0625]|uniref:hypothetical protein n=1 Tax=Arthrobacter sp. Hor0625 TaxID=3457358 RepID=UPI00403E9E5A
MDPQNNNLPGSQDYDDVPAEDPAARRRWPLAAAVVVFALAVVAGGVAVASNMRPADPAPAAASTAPVATESASATTTPSPSEAASETVSPSATPSTAAAASTAPTAGAWQTFTSTNSKVSFDYPPEWRATQRPPASAGFEGIYVDVADESGLVIASLTFGPSGGIGGACQGPVPYTVLDSAEVDLPHQPAKGSVTPRFAFRALQEPHQVTASFGLTDTLAMTNNMTCMFYNVVTGPEELPLFSFADAFQVNVGNTDAAPNHKGVKTFPSMDAARAYMQTPEYLNAKRMISSLKINQG